MRRFKRILLVIFSSILTLYSLYCLGTSIANLDTKGHPALTSTHIAPAVERILIDKSASLKSLPSKYSEHRRICPAHSVPKHIYNQTIQQPVGFLNKLLTSPVLPKRANAVIILLCRNSELSGILSSLNQYESMFNTRYRYPYVFLNDRPFSPEFKGAVSGYLKGIRVEEGPDGLDIKFSVIPDEHWGYPAFINQKKAAEVREKNKNEYIYGGLESYRFMIRYFSGPFFQHPDLLQYDYYWRVEPNVDFYCKLNYDPFVFMMENKIRYGFNIMIPELMKTIPTLFKTIHEYTYEKNISPKGLMSVFRQPDCGNGKIGSGVCPNGECCSISGWCGTTKEHCGALTCVRGCTGEDTMEKKFLQSQLELEEMRESCGNGIVGSGKCDSGECCSKWGFCSYDLDSCRVENCVGNCRQTLPETSNEFCGSGKINSGICRNANECCTRFGWCGKTEEFCGESICLRGCDFETLERKTQLKSLPVGMCGGGNVGNGICPGGKNGNPSECCSKWGFCGKTLDYCDSEICVGGCRAGIDEIIYNGNHFWTNFEIADFSFFRSTEYMDYFNHLDQSGGFFYERWGDAPVHSIAVGFLLEPEEVHYFEDIGYRHEELKTCPTLTDDCPDTCRCQGTDSNIGPWIENFMEVWKRNK